MMQTYDIHGSHGSETKVVDTCEHSPSIQPSRSSPYQSTTTIRSREDEANVGMSISMREYERRTINGLNVEHDQHRPTRYLSVADDNEMIIVQSSHVNHLSTKPVTRRDSTVLQATLALFSPKRSPIVNLTLQAKLESSMSSPVHHSSSQSVAPSPDRAPKFLVPFLESLDLRSMKNLKTFFVMHSISPGESTAMRGMHIIVRGSVKCVASINTQQASGHVKVNERVLYERKNGEWFSDVPHLISTGRSSSSVDASTKGVDYEWRDVRAIALETSFVLSCSTDRWEAFCIRFPSARVCGNVYDQLSKRSDAISSPIARHLSVQQAKQTTATFIPPPLIRRVTAPSLDFPLASAKAANDQANSPLSHRMPTSKSYHPSKEPKSSSLLTATTYDDYTLPLDTVACFQSISQLQLIQLKCLFEVCEVKADEVIFNEGDPSIGMFIIVSGRVNVSVSNHSSSQMSVQVENASDDPFIHVDTLTSRHIFGETGCINNVPRTATVTAIQRTRMLFINQSNLFQLIKLFPHLLGPHSSMRALMSHRINQSLRTLSFFDSLAVKQIGPKKLFDSRIDQIAQYFTWGIFRQGEVVYQVGDPSDTFYIIYGGGVNVYSMPQNKQEWDKYTQSSKASSDVLSTNVPTAHVQYGISVDQLSRGDFFGHLGLMHSVPRTSTVVSNQSTLVLKCKAQSFYAMFKPSLSVANNQSTHTSLDLTIVQSLDTCRQLINRFTAKDMSKQLERIPLFQSIRENHAFSKLDLISSLMVYQSYQIDSQTPSSTGSIYCEGERLTAESRVHVLIRGEVELSKKYEAPSNPNFDRLTSHSHDQQATSSYEFLVQTIKPGEWFGDTGYQSGVNQSVHSPSSTREMHLQSARVSHKHFNQSVLTVSMTRSQFHLICSLAPDLKQLFNQSITQSINLARLLGGIPLFARFIKENKPFCKAEIFASMLSINQSVKAGTIVSTASKFTILLIGSVDYRANQSISSPVIRLKSGAWFGERLVLLHESNYVARQHGANQLNSPHTIPSDGTPNSPSTQSMSRLIDPDVCHVEAVEDCVLLSMTHLQLHSFLKLAPELKDALYAIHPDIPNHLNQINPASPRHLYRTLSPTPHIKDAVQLTSDITTHPDSSPHSITASRNALPTSMSPIQEHQTSSPLLPPLHIPPIAHVNTNHINMNPNIHPHTTPVLPFAPLSPSLARSTLATRLPPLVTPTSSKFNGNGIIDDLISQSFNHSIHLSTQHIIQCEPQSIPNGIASVDTSQTTSPLIETRTLPNEADHLHHAHVITLPFTSE